MGKKIISISYLQVFLLEKDSRVCGCILSTTVSSGEKKKQVASYPNSSAHQQLVDRNGFKNSHDICANARRFRRALQREFRGETVAFNEGTLTEIKTCLSFEGRPVNKDPNVLSSCHRLHSPFCRV